MVVSCQINLIGNCCTTKWKYSIQYMWWWYIDSVLATQKVSGVAFSLCPYYIYRTNWIEAKKCLRGKLYNSFPFSLFPKCTGVFTLNAKRYNFHRTFDSVHFVCLKQSGLCCFGWNRLQTTFVTQTQLLFVLAKHFLESLYNRNI